jgi:hypothetical protein
MEAFPPPRGRRQARGDGVAPKGGPSPFSLLPPSVALSSVLLQHRARGDFFRPVPVTSRCQRALLDVLILPLLPGAHSLQVLVPPPGALSGHWSSLSLSTGTDAHVPIPVECSPLSAGAMAAAAGLVGRDVEFIAVGPVGAVIAAEIDTVDGTTAFVVTALSDSHSSPPACRGCKPRARRERLFRGYRGQNCRKGEILSGKTKPHPSVCVCVSPGPRSTRRVVATTAGVRSKDGTPSRNASLGRRPPEIRRAASGKRGNSVRGLRGALAASWELRPIPRRAPWRLRWERAQEPIPHAGGGAVLRMGREVGATGFRAKCIGEVSR